MKNLGIILVSIFLVLVAFYLLILKPDKYVQTDLYEDIRAKGLIKVGINPNSEPYGFIDKEGNYAGYDVDLANYISNQMLIKPLRVVFVPVTPANRILKVSTGEIDMVISTMTITPQREEIVDFSVPYDTAGQSLLVKKSSKISTMTDLNSQNVGVIWGTTAEKNMQKLAPMAHLIGFKSYDSAYKALKAGQIVAITSDDTILKRFAIQDKELVLLPKRYTREPYGIAFKKGKTSKRLREEVNNAIIELNEKNVIPRLHKKWLG